MKRDLNFIIAGVGGQGSILASRVVGDAAIEESYHVLIGETFGASQRGGSVLSYVRLTDERKFSPLIPEKKADVIIGLEPFEALKCAHKFLMPGGVIITNEYPIMPPDKNYPDLEKIFAFLKELSSGLYTLNATEIALGIGDLATLNIVMLGATYAVGELPLKEENIKQAIKERLPKTADLNLRAFYKGKEGVTKK